MPTLRPRLLTLGLVALLGTHAAFAADAPAKQPDQPPLSEQTQRSGGTMPAEQKRLRALLPQRWCGVPQRGHWRVVPGVVKSIRSRAWRRCMYSPLIFVAATT